MKRFGFVLLTLILAFFPVSAQAQRGGRGMGGMGGMDGMGGQNVRFNVPKLPGPELDGPPDTTAARKLLSLTPDQERQYAQAYDSFMVVSRPQRDSIHTQLDIMSEKLTGGDRAAALFYAERATKVSEGLKEHQTRWEEGTLFKIFSGDQSKVYKKWKKDADDTDAERQKKDSMRWNPMMGGSDRLGGGGGGGGEQKTSITAPVGSPSGTAAAVRVGRTVYVAGQVALDAEGNMVGEGDLHAQTVKAFANLTTVLLAARARPIDVVRLTIYIVNYKPQDMALVREAGAAFLPQSDPPALTVVGVQSLYREGLLISIEATALAGAPGTSPRAGPLPR